MKEVPTEHLLVLSKLANLYYEQGHKDEAAALCNQIIELCYPHILEQAKSDKRYIYELIKQKNCKDERLSYEAKIILQFFFLKNCIRAFSSRREARSTLHAHSNV